jgi:putative FmdB family regulatory protein
MPIYAYRCNECGFEKDVLQKLSDAPLTDCPSCGKPAFKKQVTAAGFQLKGSGWYVTDFRDNKKPSGKEASKGDNKTEGNTPADKGAASTPAPSNAAAPAPAAAAPAAAAPPPASSK